MPKISIVMPTYNQEKYVKEAVQSLLEQTEPDFELIIVNDGSTDNTGKIIDEIGTWDPRIKVFHKENGGTGSALNLGFEHATGKYETWNASDNKMYPNYLEDLSKVLDENFDIDFVYGNTVIGVMNPDGVTIKKTKNLKEEVGSQKWNPTQFYEQYNLGIAWLWRKEVRIVAGSKFISVPCEDFEMTCRMVETGARFYFLDKTLSWFRRHSKNMSAKLGNDNHSHVIELRDKLIQRKNRKIRDGYLKYEVDKVVVLKDNLLNKLKRGVITENDLPVIDPYDDLGWVRNKKIALDRGEDVFSEKKQSKISEENKDKFADESKKIETMFTDIYKKNVWGSKESASGKGSEIAQTEKMRKKLVNLIQKYEHIYHIKSILDIGCGDLNWVSQILMSLPGIKYTGVEIVGDLVEENKRKYPQYNFIKKNVINDPLDVHADLIICRDAMVHWSFKHILFVIEKFVKSGSKLLLATTFDRMDRTNAMDITAYEVTQWRPVNMCIPPVGLPDPIDIIKEGCTEAVGSATFEDKSLALWRLSDIARKFNIEIPTEDELMKERERISEKMLKLKQLNADLTPAKEELKSVEDQIREKDKFEVKKIENNWGNEPLILGFKEKVEWKEPVVYSCSDIPDCLKTPPPFEPIIKEIKVEPEGPIKLQSKYEEVVGEPIVILPDEKILTEMLEKEIKEERIRQDFCTQKDGTEVGTKADLSDLDPSSKEKKKSKKKVKNPGI